MGQSTSETPATAQGLDEVNRSRTTSSTLKRTRGGVLSNRETVHIDLQIEAKAAMKVDTKGGLGVNGHSYIKRVTVPEQKATQQSLANEE